MKVVAVSTLKSLWKRYPDSENPLKAWYDEAKHTAWNTPQDIRDHYASPSFVGHNRVLFDIKGNEYRLIVAVTHWFQAIYIKFIGTHAEYDCKPQRPRQDTFAVVFRDEAAVERWRQLEQHRVAQQRGRAGIFRDYRLRVACVIRDYGMAERTRPRTTAATDTADSGNHPDRVSNMTRQCVMY